MQFKKDGRWAIDFVGVRKIAAIVSLVMVISSIAVFFGVQPNWGIDFTGGTEIHLKTRPAADISEIRETLGELGLGSDSVQQVGDELEGEFVVRIQDPTFGTEGLEEKVSSELREAFGQDWIKEVAFDAQVDVTMTVLYLENPDRPIRIEEIREVLTDERIRGVAQGDENSVRVEFEPTSNLIEAKLRASYGGAQATGADEGSSSDYNYRDADGTFYQDSEVETRKGEGEEVTVEMSWASEKVTTRHFLVGTDTPVTKPFEVLAADQVGPKVGGELRQQGLLAIVATLALILLYVAFRFELGFAPGAVLALLHDVTIVVGIFTLTGHEFNLSMIGALLTIIGYSLNDTIVIYDRIRENMSKYRRKDTAQMINDSINETLSRTLATSFTTMLAMSAFLILGGPVIETFALAIMMGVIFGTYSTVFVASPTILVMEDLKPHLGRFFAPLASKASQETEEAPSTAAAARQIERETLKKVGPEV